MIYICKNNHTFEPTVTHPVCPTCDQPGTPMTHAQPPDQAQTLQTPYVAPAGGKKKKK